jgi:hypothetical protein
MIFRDASCREVDWSRAGLGLVRITIQSSSEVEQAAEEILVSGCPEGGERSWNRVNGGLVR